MKKSVTSALIALSILFGATTIPAKKANAGVLIMTTSFLYGGPILGIAGQFIGFGTSVTSIYWTIANLDKAWWGWGLFMLDEQVTPDNVEQLISTSYPDLESSLVKEISSIILDKANLVQLNPKGYKDIVLTEEELSPVLDVLSATNPELGQQLKSDLTKSFLSLSSKEF